MRVEFVGGPHDGEQMDLPHPFPILLRPAGDVQMVGWVPEDPDAAPDDKIRVLTYERAGRRHPNGPVLFRLKV